MKRWMGGKGRRNAIQRTDGATRQRQFFAARREQNRRRKTIDQNTEASHPHPQRPHPLPPANPLPTTRAASPAKFQKSATPTPAPLQRFAHLRRQARPASPRLRHNRHKIHKKRKTVAPLCPDELRLASAGRLDTFVHNARPTNSHREVCASPVARRPRQEPAQSRIEPVPTQTAQPHRSNSSSEHEEIRIFDDEHEQTYKSRKRLLSSAFLNSKKTPSPPPSRRRYTASGWDPPKVTEREDSAQNRSSFDSWRPKSPQQETNDAGISSTHFPFKTSAVRNPLHATPYRHRRSPETRNHVRPTTPRHVEIQFKFPAITLTPESPPPLLLNYQSRSQTLHMQKGAVSRNVHETSLLSDVPWHLQSASAELLHFEDVLFNKPDTTVRLFTTTSIKNTHRSTRTISHQTTQLKKYSANASNDLNMPKCADPEEVGVEKIGVDDDKPRKADGSEGIGEYQKLVRLHLPVVAQNPIAQAASP